MSPYQLHVEKWTVSGGCGSSICSGAQHLCFTRGTIPCDVLFVGEAPGESEDVLGKPFKGPAGHLMDQIVSRAWKGKSLTWAMTNLVCCYPRELKKAGVNEPPREAIYSCNVRLVEFVRICQPKLIVLVGKLAAQHIRGEAQFRLDNKPEQELEWLNGKFMQFCEISHPAAIIRANIAQRGLMMQRAVVLLSNALEGLYSA